MLSSQHYPQYEDRHFCNLKVHLVHTIIFQPLKQAWKVKTHYEHELTFDSHLG